MKKNQIQGKSARGFTLIEVIVSIFIFSILAVLISSVFISALNMERRAYNIQQVVENVNYILEAMVKEIRMANLPPQDTDANCLSPAEEISFVNTKSEAIRYFMDGGRIHREIDGVDTIISSNTIEFNRFQFCIIGTAVNDNIQPRITITAGIRSREAAQRETVEIQTTLSQRYLSD